MLVLAVALVTVLPARWRRTSNGESVFDWLRLREAELSDASEEERASLLVDAELRVLDEIERAALVSADESSQVTASGNSVPAASTRRGLMVGIIVALVLASVALYESLGALDDVLIANQLDSVASSSPEDISRLIERIENRAASRPDNGDYLSLLGEYYTGQERYGDALAVYTRLLTLFPESPDVLARAAQADYLSNGRVLQPRAKRWAEAALAADPNQRTALGTLGMASFEAQDYSAALEHWQRLLAFEAPGSPGAQMLASVMSEARRRMSESGATDSSNTTADVAATQGVTVVVQMPEGGSVAPSATVFVIARPAGSKQRMPTAVVKRSAAELPFSVRLDDGSAMAGQRISTLEAVDIEVQVNPSGQPGRSQASWLGQASNITPSPSAETTITLQAVSQ